MAMTFMAIYIYAQNAGQSPCPGPKDTNRWSVAFFDGLCLRQHAFFRKFLTQSLLCHSRHALANR